MDPLNLLRLLLVFVHLVGMALVLGGFATQYLARRYSINKAMVYGSVTQVVTGVMLAAPWPRDVAQDPIKLVVKLILGVTIAAMVLVVRRRDKVKRGHFVSIGGLTLATVGVAVFWP